jgi:PAS domain S-box-containing protein
MRGRRVVLYLILIMTTVALVIDGVAIRVLYDTALAEQRARLVETAQSQARLIEAIARFNAAHSRRDDPEGPQGATLSQIADAHERYAGFGKTGEFTLARREGDNIVFLLSHRHYDLENPKPIPFDGELGEPMRRALRGQSGTLIGLDYRGVRVLAAHEPVAGLNWGIVAKIDLAEVRAPFLRAGLIMACAGLAVVAAGAVLFIRVSSPLVRGLEESEARTRAILRTAADGIITVNEKGVVDSFNTAGEQIFEYATDEVIGQDIRTLLPSLQGDKCGDFPADFLCNGWSEDEHVHRQVVGRRRDGARFPADLAVSEVQLPDRRMFTIIVRDITERKQREQELRLQGAALQSAANAIVITDRSGTILWVNDAFTRLVGFGRHEAIGKNPRIVKSGVHDESFYKHLWDTILSGNAWHGELINRRKDGAHYPEEMTITPVFDDPNEITGFVAIKQDVTERKQVEERLATLVGDLERSNSELRQFAYVASHDLREPLRMVASYTQLLQERYKGKLDAEADEFIQFASDGAIRMQKLIDDLLSYSRIRTRSMCFEATDCQSVLQEAVANLRVAVTASNAVITNDHLPTVMADRGQFTQLFQNLIGNAIKFRSEQPPRIHVSAKRKGDEWLFSVRDNGIGIDPQYSDRVLKIFQRLHARDKYSGTGIGLAICNKIVERHGGRIWVESEAGKGSTFFFTVRARDGDKA